MKYFHNIRCCYLFGCFESVTYWLIPVKAAENFTIKPKNITLIEHPCKKSASP